jgi:hypothetical protein
MTTNPTCPPVVASSTVGSVNADSLRFHGPTVYGMSRAALVTSTEGLARDLASPKITARHRPARPDQRGGQSRRRSCG